MAAPAGAPPAAPPPGAPPAAPPAGAPPAAPNTISLPGIGAITQQPDGTWKAANGLIFISNGHGGITPDPASLAQVTAAAGKPGSIIDAVTGKTPGLNLTPGANDWENGIASSVLSGGSTAIKTLGNEGATDAGDAATAVGDALNGLGGGGAGPDGSDADAETTRANALADALGGQAGTAGAQADTDRGLGTQTRAQQEDSITGLTAAANGTAPSAAELQLKQQSGIDAARQYGLAAALQGNNPGAALRQASLGAAQIAGTTDQNAAINRANEQATARGQLATTLANVRSGDQGAVNTDVSQQNDLNQGQLTSQGQGVTSTGQKIAAKSAKYSADQVAKGAAIGAAGTLAAGLLSDKRAKKNIVRTDLADALGKEVHGVRFEYRPEAEEDDAQHFGILADALGKVIPGVVKKGPSGFKEVHTGHLALANVGVTAELARRLQDLEKGKGARR